EAPIRGALYAPLMWPLGRLVVLLAGARGSASGVGFDGFYGDRDHFDEKLERDRRYGSIYKIVDRDDAYILRLEFPRRPPTSSGSRPRCPTTTTSSACRTAPSWCTGGSSTRRCGS